MNIEVTGRHFHVSEALREYATTKANKLTRFYDGIQRIQVLLTGDGNEQAVELIVAVNKGQTIVANERQDSMYAAIDLAVDKAQSQLKRFKDKMQNHRGRKAETGVEETNEGVEVD